MYKISIITATYNCEDTIEQTILSVINQDYSNIEYLIVDGKSKDNTMNIVEKYTKYGIKWISELDTGVYDAFNKGVEMATGDYIYFLGSDDALYDRKTISNIVKELDKDTDVLSAAVIVVDEVSKKEYPVYNHHVKSNFKGGMVPHQGMFCKTSLIKKYKFDIRYSIIADHKFFLQCYYDNNVKIKYIDEIVAFYANAGISHNLSKAMNEKEMLFKELNLPFYKCMFSSESNIKRFTKYILYKINLLNIFLCCKMIITNKIKRCFVWRKHYCNNEICRWCGRKDINIHN